MVGPCGGGRWRDLPSRHAAAVYPSKRASTYARAVVLKDSRFTTVDEVDSLTVLRRLPGLMMTVIITADDFGIDTSSSEVIVEALAGMGRTPACSCLRSCRQAWAGAGARVDTGIGVHLNFSEGAPLTAGIKGSDTFCADGHFLPSGSSALPAAQRRGSCWSRPKYAPSWTRHRRAGSGSRISIPTTTCTSRRAWPGLSRRSPVSSGSPGRVFQELRVTAGSPSPRPASDLQRLARPAATPRRPVHRNHRGYGVAGPARDARCERIRRDHDPPREAPTARLSTCRQESLETRLKRLRPICRRARLVVRDRIPACPQPLRRRRPAVRA